ncbi:MAG: hypothetical protein QOG06_1522, partial [Gaiellaceae bacterium]|nr:hypothetical protein [Gaiellaceae bacterium]
VLRQEHEQVVEYRHPGRDRRLSTARDVDPRMHPPRLFGQAEPASH